MIPCLFMYTGSPPLIHTGGGCRIKMPRPDGGPMRPPFDDRRQPPTTSPDDRPVRRPPPDGRGRPKHLLTTTDSRMATVTVYT